LFLGKWGIDMSKHRNRLLLGTAILCVALVAARPAPAQEYRGTVAGQVTDEQGGALPGVAVTATHIETGTASTSVTDSSGLYSFPLLPPGVYSVAAELSGFQRMVRDRVTLGAGQRAVVDFQLAIGSVQESVTVTAEAALLQTGTARLGLSVAVGQME